MRILRVAHDKYTSQAVTILLSKVAVVPECALKVRRGIGKFKRPGCDSTLLTYCLVLDIEFVFERLSRYDRTLIDKGTTVGRIGPMLVDTVPMLHEHMNKHDTVLSRSELLTIDVTTSMLLSCSSLMTLIAKVSPCQCTHGSPHIMCSILELTFFPVIVGPGNVPPARTALTEKRLRW
jgi:hypothetical protein